MRLIPWTRENDGFGALQRQMSRLFEDFLPATAGGTAWLPSVDVSETEEDVIVRAEIPGIPPKEVEVAVIGDTLHLRGEKRAEKEQQDKNWHRVERRYGAFDRTIQLPCEVDSEKARAEASDGVLTITVGKAAPVRTRKIDVKVR